jgi:HK97 family phage portal protein
MRNPLTSLKAWLNADDLEAKFSPADPSVNWQRVETLIHGPAAWEHPEATDTNSAAFACLMVLASSAIEPRLRVYRDTGDGQPEPLDEHPAQALLDDPNPVLTPEEIYFWLYWALHLDGNSYLLKRRAGDATRGNVVELWPVSPTRMTPVTERDSPNLIDRYSFRVGPSERRDIPVENVVHLRLGLDDRDMRLGLSPFKRLVRSIGTDEEADRYISAFLRNYGVPGLFILLKDPALDEASAMAIKRRFQAEFGEEGRGRVGVLNNDADVKTVGASPEQANTDRLREVPEARIAAVLGVPPAMAGLSVGLAQTSNFASMKQVAENFTERKLVPLWRLVGSKLSHRSGLRPDFFGSDPNVAIRHDLSTVRALAEDEDARYRRFSLALTSGGITLEEYRAALGYDAEPKPDETLLVPSNLTPTLVSELHAPPEPVPTPLRPAGEGGPPPDGAAADDAPAAAARPRVARKQLAVAPLVAGSDPDASDAEAAARLFDSIFAGTRYEGILEAAVEDGRNGHG